MEKDGVKINIFIIELFFLGGVSKHLNIYISIMVRQFPFCCAD